jgi:ABC-type transport system substrate-binding protein
MNWATGILPSIESGFLPMFQIGWLADYPDPDNFVTPFMASWGSYAAFQSYNNPEVDALVTEGATSVDAARRQQIYYKLQDLYYNDAPGISLVQPAGVAPLPEVDSKPPLVISSAAPPVLPSSASPRIHPVLMSCRLKFIQLRPGSGSLDPEVALQTGGIGRHFHR